MNHKALRPLVAGRRHCCDLIERPLYNAGQPSRCEGLLRIVVLPFSAGAWLTLTDPLQPFVLLRSGRSRTKPLDRLPRFAEVKEKAVRTQC
jgi:hypothetical protein